MKLSEFKSRVPDLAALSELNNKVENFKNVLNLVKQINVETNKRKVLNLIIQSALKVSGCTRGAVLILKNDELDFKIGLNINNAVISESEFNISYTVCNDVINTGKSMFIEKTQGSDSFQPTVSITALKLQTIFCSPLIIDDKKLGVLYTDCANMSGTDISAVNEYFEIFASHAAVALRNAKQFG